LAALSHLRQQMPKIVAYALEVFLYLGGNLTPFDIANIIIMLHYIKISTTFSVKKFSLFVF